MAKFFRNRSSEEWRAVLEGLGFRWTNNDGDDQVWTYENHPNIAVLVPSRNEDIIIPTAMDMARKICICKGIKKKDILAWWKKNNYGE